MVSITDLSQYNRILYRTPVIILPRTLIVFIAQRSNIITAHTMTVHLSSTVQTTVNPLFLLFSCLLTRA